MESYRKNAVSKGPEAPSPKVESTPAELERMLGLTLDSVEVGQFEITFKSKDGRTFRMFHEDDGSEIVHVEDVVGDVEDLVGSPLLRAEERSQRDPNAYESGSWTFYEFATIKGSVTIRWYGSSNGWYGEEVTLEEVRPKRRH